MTGRPRRAVVVGGGLAGMGAAHVLAEAGTDVTLIERGDELGGLAGSVERDGNFYPLAYHHILHRDRALLWFLDRIGTLDRVRWRRVRMLFHRDGRFHDLASPAGFARFPMSIADKLRFVRLMLRAFGKSDWRDWEGRPASELIDAWGGPGVREALFEPLTRLKFDLPCSESSAAWIGARLHFREGSSPFGYVPGANWTERLCRGLTERLASLGVRIHTSTTVVGTVVRSERIDAVQLADGRLVEGDAFVFTVPTVVYRRLAPADRTPELARIRYTAMLSAIVTTRQRVDPSFYWLNLLDRRQASTGIFLLDTLNPTIGGRSDRTLNFTTHLPSPDHPLFALDDGELLARYAADFRELFGTPLSADWSRVVRIPLYSPIFDRDYRNPPPRSASYGNAWFAGNFRTHPSVASTGTALRSGVDAGCSLLHAIGVVPPETQAAIDGFRAPRMLP